MNSSDELDDLMNDDNDLEAKYHDPNQIGSIEAIEAEILYFKSKQEEEKANMYETSKVISDFELTIDFFSFKIIKLNNYLIFRFAEK